MEPRPADSPHLLQASVPLVAAGLFLVLIGWFWIRDAGHVNPSFLGAAIAAGAAVAASLRSDGPQRGGVWIFRVALIVPILAIVWDVARAPAGHYIAALGGLSGTLGVRVWLESRRAAAAGKRVQDAPTPVGDVLDTGCAVISSREQVPGDHVDDAPSPGRPTTVSRDSDGNAAEGGV